MRNPPAPLLPACLPASPARGFGAQARPPRPRALGFGDGRHRLTAWPLALGAWTCEAPSFCLLSGKRRRRSLLNGTQVTCLPGPLNSFGPRGRDERRPPNQGRDPGGRVLAARTGGAARPGRERGAPSGGTGSWRPLRSSLGNPGKPTGRLGRPRLLPCCEDASMAVQLEIGFGIFHLRTSALWMRRLWALRGRRGSCWVA